MGEYKNTYQQPDAKEANNFGAKYGNRNKKTKNKNKNEGTNNDKLQELNKDPKAKIHLDLQRTTLKKKTTESENANDGKQEF